MKRLRPCLEQGCPDLVYKGRCAKHTRSTREERWGKDLYQSAVWRGLRRLVRREQPFCAVPGCNNPTTDVDHIVALRDGGEPFDRANLQGLCKKCHSEKTAKEVWGRK